MEIIKGIVLEGEKIEVCYISNYEFNTYKWEQCEVPAMLGVPISLSVVRPSKKTNIRHYLTPLMVSSKNGITPYEWQTDKGKVMCFRRDKKTFSIDDYYNLNNYICEEYIAKYLDNTDKQKLSILSSFAYNKWVRNENQLLYSSLPPPSTTDTYKDTYKYTDVSTNIFNNDLYNPIDNTNELQKLPKTELNNDLNYISQSNLVDKSPVLSNNLKNDNDNKKTISIINTINTILRNKIKMFAFYPKINTEFDI